MPPLEPDPRALLQALRQTRESLEELQSKILAAQEERDLTVTEESQLRKVRRALRKINQEYLPWARIGKLSATQAAEIAFRLNVIWASLPLEE